MQSSEAMQREVAVLEAERGRLARELAVRAEMEAGFAKRGVRQAAAAKEAQARIAGLEGSLAQVGCLLALLISSSAARRRQCGRRAACSLLPAAAACCFAVEGTADKGRNGPLPTSGRLT
jgi:hypothetical protein